MPVSEAQKRATAKFEKERYDKVLVRFPKGTKEKILNAGAESVNGYIIKCVLDSLENAQNATTSGENTKADKSIDEVSNAAMLSELQAELDARKVKHPDEMTAEEREQVRQESIAKSECPF